MLFKQKKLAIITVVSGAMLEYYSYMLLATMISKAEFLNKFFAPGSDSSQILKGSLFFLIAALFRPLGALIFGWIGDKYGRRQALFAALITMSISGFVIAALPIYQTVGSIALITLFLARVAQIMSASGETNGAPIFLIEHFGISRSCLASGLAYFGTMLGSTMASFASNTFTGDLWRFSFLIGGFAGLCGILIRVNLKESKEFTQSNQDSQHSDMSKQSFESYLIVGIISAACSSGFYFMYIAVPMIFCHSCYSMYDYVTYSTFAYSAILLFTGYITDYLQIFNVMRFGAISFICSTIALLTQLVHPIFGYFWLTISLGIFAAPSHSFMYRFFPPRCRYRAVSITYSIATATIGAGTPYICRYLVAYFNSTYAALFWITPIMLITYFALNRAQIIWNNNSHLNN